MIDWSNFNSSLIIEVTRPEGVFTCTGVAINSNTIVTAAHCLEGKVLHVRVSLESEYNPKGNYIGVEAFELHPDYNSRNSNFKCDIARIQLENELPESIMIFPIMKKISSFHGKLLRLGFGARNNKNVRTLITPMFRDHRVLEDVLELDDMFSFSGDSGGPIFLQQNGQMYLIAVHSTLSHGPQGKHSFNPLLSRHKKWLESSFSLASVAEELQRAV